MTMIPTAAADAATTNEHQDYHLSSSPPLSPSSTPYQNDYQYIGASLLNYIQTPAKGDHGSGGRKRRRNDDDHHDDDDDIYAVDPNVNNNGVQEDEFNFNNINQRGQNQSENHHDQHHILEHEELTEVVIVPQFVPCLLLDVGDHQINQTNNTTDDHMLQLLRQRQYRQCMWLQGPRKSGKSSLAMNFAYSIAAVFSADTFSYATTTTIETNSSSLAGINSPGKKHKSHDVSCVLYMPNNTSSNDNARMNINNHESQNLFPLFCERRKSPTRNSTMAGTASIGKNNDQNVNDSNENGDHTYWDPTVLRRIRIHRVQSIREMLEDMTSMLGKPIEEQPIGGAIVIDGIDQIILNDIKLKNKTKKTTFEANNSNAYHHAKNGGSNFDGYNDYTKKTKTEMDIVNIAKSTVDAMTEIHDSYTSLLVTKTMTSSPPSSSLASPSVISGPSHGGGKANVPVWVSNEMDATVTLQERSTLSSTTTMGTMGSTSSNQHNHHDNKIGSKQVKQWIATITNCSGTDGRKTIIDYKIENGEQDSEFHDDHGNTDDGSSDFNFICRDEERIAWSCPPQSSK